MIDIHSHILPELDDGACSFQQSLEMLALAVEHGTTDIVASPHSDLRFRYDRDLVAERISALQAECPEIRIHRGCDFHLIPERIQEALADPARYSIDGKGFLLVEFPDDLIPESADELLEQMRDRGLQPVLTHPERNRVLQGDQKRIRYWVERGSMVQITAQSVVGKFGRTAARISKELLSVGLVHFVASDAHDAKHRPPVLSEAFEAVSADYGKKAANLLFVENPTCAIEGSPADVRPMNKKQSAWRWFRG